MIEMKEFAERRNALMRRCGKDSVVIIPAARLLHRNADTEYPYRPNSDFYYLTGFDEPEAVLVLLPNRTSGEFVLFSRQRHRDEEIWTGQRAGQEGARQIFFADEAFAIDCYAQKLVELLEGRGQIFYSLGLDKQYDEILLNAMNRMRGKIRAGAEVPFEMKDVSLEIAEMRLIKSPAEIDLMRKAAEISAQAHRLAMQHCRPGLYEYELEAEMIYHCQKQGARFQAYPTIVGGGKNSCTLHYTSNHQRLSDGSVVLIDGGCEYQYYAADITRTFPVNGKFSKEQAAIYEIVLQAQLAALKVIKPGALWSEAQDAIALVITEGLLSLGILQGSLSDLLAAKAYLPFYMHKSGHWLGLDVHDAGRYKLSGEWRTLQPGMVLTVEPGLYMLADTPGLDSRWHNIGVRIEDDVLVTSSGHEVLSHAAPKTIDAIEAIMRQA